MDLRRSSVTVIDEMARSILPVFSAGIRPTKVVFCTTSSLCMNAAMARAMSTLMPEGSLCSSVISKGG